VDVHVDESGQQVLTARVDEPRGRRHFETAERPPGRDAVAGDQHDLVGEDAFAIHRYDGHVDEREGGRLPGGGRPRQRLRPCTGGEQRDEAGAADHA
jgi:hypothetical protein